MREPALGRWHRWRIQLPTDAVGQRQLLRSDPRILEESEVERLPPRRGVDIQIATDFAGEIQQKAGKVIRKAGLVPRLVQTRLAVTVPKDAAGAERLTLS